MSGRHHAFVSELRPSTSGLTGTDKTILAHIALRTNSDTGEAFPSLRDCSVVTGYSVDTVRRSIRSLAAAGWMAVIPRKRDNGSSTSSLFVIDLPRVIAQVDADKAADEAKKREAAARKSGEHPPSTMPPPPSTVQGGEGSTMLGGGVHHATPIIKKLNNNSLSDAQARERMALRDELIGLAGDALADPASNLHAANPMPLIYLLNDLPHSPACTADELRQATISAAAYFRGKGRQMSSWDFAVKLACELRDKRIAGVPVKPVAGAAKAQGSGANPAGFDQETWRKAIRVAKYKGRWPDEYGPEPGAEGSLVPDDLVSLWVA
ncbi:MAG: helix-turn-helix domain-containing protein [Asticcacaulis sp.]